jgi:hypothetical protein
LNIINLIIKYKVIAALAALYFLGLASGYKLFHSAAPYSVTAAARLEQRTADSATVQNNRTTVTRVIYRAGPVKEKTTTTQMSKLSEFRNTSQASVESSTRDLTATPLKVYSLGVGIVFPDILKPQNRDLEFTGGYRLLGPVWGELGIIPAQRSVLLRARIEL